ncbi:hypothetical protein HPB48_018313 [Haemaphysalis longicornis]|uniref:DDE-1 domain-containing protein n=1 Tax=Haemaphysalis longicornis TaxID=44386 RepID=A0A9J6GSZ5_HAELO|nr:hypothetical protein HPB48_018313 [Haemaphysalis longicornis]
MKRQDGSVCLLLDNCSAHRLDGSVKLTNVELKFFPPNCTSLIQPLDQGVINSVKYAYRPRLLQRILLNTEHGRDTKVDLYRAVQMAVQKSGMVFRRSPTSVTASQVMDSLDVYVVSLAPMTMMSPCSSSQTVSSAFSRCSGESANSQKSAIFSSFGNKMLPECRAYPVHIRDRKLKYKLRAVISRRLLLRGSPRVRRAYYNAGLSAARRVVTANYDINSML